MMTTDKIATDLDAVQPASYVDWTGFLLRAMKRFAALLVAVPLALAVAAAVTYVPTWESIKTIRIGFVDGKPAEVAFALQERINNHWFRDRVVKSIGLDPEDPAVRTLRKAMRISAITPELVRVRVVGRSPEESARLLEALVAQIVSEYEGVREMKHQALMARLQAMQRDLAERREAMQKLTSTMIAGGRPNDGLAGIAVLYQASQSSDLNMLEDRVHRFADRLGPEMTWPTSTFVQTTTTIDPSEPSRSMRTLVAAALGFLSAAVISFLLHWYLVRRQGV